MWTLTLGKKICSTMMIMRRRSQLSLLLRRFSVRAKATVAARPRPQPRNKALCCSPRRMWQKSQKLNLPPRLSQSTQTATGKMNDPTQTPQTETNSTCLILDLTSEVVWPRSWLLPNKKRFEKTLPKSWDPSPTTYSRKQKSLWLKRLKQILTMRMICSRRNRRRSLPSRKRPRSRRILMTPTSTSQRPRNPRNPRPRRTSWTAATAVTCPLMPLTWAQLGTGQDEPRP